MSRAARDARKDSPRLSLFYTDTGRGGRAGIRYTGEPPLFEARAANVTLALLNLAAVIESEFPHFAERALVHADIAQQVDITASC